MTLGHERMNNVKVDVAMSLALTTCALFGYVFDSMSGSFVCWCFPAALLNKQQKLPTCDVDIPVFMCFVRARFLRLTCLCVRLCSLK